ncbi:MAG: TlpA disulfide reductase family protein [Desulfonatronovibrionaceae bacterium]
MKTFFSMLTALILWTTLTCPAMSGEIVDSLGPSRIEKIIAREKGKVLIMNFWATWCGPCKAEIKDMIQIRKKYSPDQLTIIGPSLDYDPAMIQDFADNMGINYPVFHAREEVMAHFGIESIPFTMIFDGQGRKTHEFYQLVEKEQLEQIIRNLAGE